MFSFSRILPRLLLLVLLWPSLARSQHPRTSTPTAASCQPQLLSLAPCAPYVQGTAPSPPHSCCNTLHQIYTLQPHCLCLLLNTTDIVSIPINNTLALQLPRLCNIPDDPSSCGLSPVRPPSQVSLGANSSHSVAASPAALGTPGPSVTGLHESSSGGAKSEIEFELVVAAGAVTMIMMIILA